jgi:hypothetical protein
MLSPGRPKPHPKFTTASVLIDRNAVVSKMLEANVATVKQMMFIEGCQPVRPSKPAITIVIVNSIPRQKLQDFIIDIAIDARVTKATPPTSLLSRGNQPCIHTFSQQITPEAIQAALGHFIRHIGSPHHKIMKCPG